MRTYHVLIFIACVMACLAALCFVLPGRLVLGDKELKWPTFAEVMGTTHTGELRIETDTLVIDTTALPPDCPLPSTWTYILQGCRRRW